MTAPTDQSAALALLRERFPESEGWRVDVSPSARESYGAVAERQHTFTGGPIALSDQWASVSGSGSTAMLAVHGLIASWDAATHAEYVREFVVAVRALVASNEISDECDYDLDARNDVRFALASLPASLRGEGGERG